MYVKGEKVNYELISKRTIINVEITFKESIISTQGCDSIFWLKPPHSCACPNIESGGPTSYVVVSFVFDTLR